MHRSNVGRFGQINAQIRDRAHTRTAARRRRGSNRRRSRIGRPRRPATAATGSKKSEWLQTSLSATNFLEHNEVLDFKIFHGIPVLEFIVDAYLIERIEKANR